MNPADFDAFFAEIQACVATYLDGRREFSDGAQDLAAVIRRLISSAVKPGAQPRYETKTVLTVAHRQEPPSEEEFSRMPGRRLAPGRPMAEEERAAELWIEAVRLLDLGRSGPRHP
jgi:hypothetical protein